VRVGHSYPSPVPRERASAGRAPGTTWTARGAVHRRWPAAKRWEVRAKRWEVRTKRWRAKAKHRPAHGAKSNGGRRFRRPPLRPNPDPAPVRAWVVPGEGSGRGLSAPVGPLGTLRRSCDLLRFPNRIPVEALLPRRFPGRGFFRSKLLKSPSQVHRPEAWVPAGKSGKSGFGFRLALLSLVARSPASSSRSLRSVRSLAAVASSSLAPVSRTSASPLRRANLSLLAESRQHILRVPACG
jgi:hypothetical protein